MSFLLACHRQDRDHCGVQRIGIAPDGDVARPLPRPRDPELPGVGKVQDRDKRPKVRVGRCAGAGLRERLGT